MENKKYTKEEAESLFKKYGSWPLGYKSVTCNGIIFNFDRTDEKREAVDYMQEKSSLSHE